MYFGQCTFSGLNEGDTVLRVLLSGFQTGDLGTHLLRNRQTSRIVASAIDLVAGRQLLEVLGQSRSVVGVVAVGVHRHDVMLNTHKIFPPTKCLINVTGPSYLPQHRSWSAIWLRTTGRTDRNH